LKAVPRLGVLPGWGTECFFRKGIINVQFVTRRQVYQRHDRSRQTQTEASDFGAIGEYRTTSSVIAVLSVGLKIPKGREIT
jgi:hypothetical protein